MHSCRHRQALQQWPRLPQPAMSASQACPWTMHLHRCVWMPFKCMPPQQRARPLPLCLCSGKRCGLTISLACDASHTSCSGASLMMRLPPEVCQVLACWLRGSTACILQLGTPPSMGSPWTWCALGDRMHFVCVQTSFPWRMHILATEELGNALVDVAEQFYPQIEVVR